MRVFREIFEAFAPMLFVLVCIVAVGCVLGGLAVLGNVVTADGNVTGCLLEAEFAGSKSVLIGVRDWRSDLRLGTFATLDEAVAAAAKLQCKLLFTNSDTQKESH